MNKEKDMPSAEKLSKKKALIAASVAGLIAVVGAAMMPSSAIAADENCYGINACKGTGDCGGTAHSCAGQNACKGTAYLKLPAGTCEKIEGGSLTPPA